MFTLYLANIHLAIVHIDIQQYSNTNLENGETNKVEMPINDFLLRRSSCQSDG